MNIFVVSNEFARPMAMTVPGELDSLRTDECGECHAAINETTGCLEKH